MKSEIGLIGLAVMGENLALNMLKNGYQVSVYNRTISKTENFVTTRAANYKVVAGLDLEQFCNSLSRPRKIIMMVKAGAAVDDLISQLLPFLEQGDILIDGGNSHYQDTLRRYDELAKNGILFVGCGISGGEEGALNGPSIMPGGASAAWPEIRPILTKIAAKVKDQKSGNIEPCCDWVGEGGAGHFVKMVHNGIEYADMQVISESYHLLKDLVGLDNPELADVYQSWNSSELESYLIEITSKIMNKKEQSGRYLLDLILDSAGQKGTGKWTVNLALEQSQPSNVLAEAVFARFISAQLQERKLAAELYPAPIQNKVSKEKTIEQIKRAVYCAKIASYAQGFSLMSSASSSFNWSLNLGSVAMMWRGGCIIRSRFLSEIKNAYTEEANLPNLLLSEFFSGVIKNYLEDWRSVVALAVENGIAVPVMSSALSYFDSYRSARLPANLIQAQRDFFGAHTYERIDQPRDMMFHTEWE